MPRIRSELWVAAYLRSSAARAVPALLIARGDPDSGSIFVKIARLDGTALLFGPPPIGAAPEDDGRWFTPLPAPGPRPEREVDAYLSEQRAFDSDLWIVEVEDRQGIHGLDDWLIQPAP